MLPFAYCATTITGFRGGKYNNCIIKSQDYTFELLGQDKGAVTKDAATKGVEGEVSKAGKV